VSLTDIINKLVELQTADSGHDHLEKHRQSLLDKLDLAAAHVSALKNQALEEKKTQESLAKQRKTFEIEVGALETRLTRYQSQLDEVKSNKEYEALKLEIEKHKEEKNKLEEKVLEILFQEDTHATPRIPHLGGRGGLLAGPGRSKANGWRAPRR